MFCEVFLKHNVETFPALEMTGSCRPATKVTSKSRQVSQSRHCLGESLAQSDSKHLDFLFKIAKDRN